MLRSILGTGLILGLLASPASSQGPPVLLLSWGSQGSGPGQFTNPAAVSVDAYGHVFVGDGDRIQIFDTNGVFQSQWQIDLPGAVTSLAADGQGRLHMLVNVESYYPGRVETYYEILTTAGVVLRSARVFGIDCECTGAVSGIGSDLAGNSAYSYWSNVSVVGLPPHNAWVIRRDDASNTTANLSTWGAGPGQLNQPWGVAIDILGRIYVTDWGNHRVVMMNSDGSFAAQWGSSGSGDGQFNFPWAIAVGPGGNVYVTDILLGRVQEFTGSGQFLSKWGSPGSGPGQFAWPSGIAVDALGNIYVADANNYRVSKFGQLPTPEVPVSWGQVKVRYR